MTFNPTAHKHMLPKGSPLSPQKYETPKPHPERERERESKCVCEFICVDVCMNRERKEKGDSEA